MLHRDVNLPAEEGLGTGVVTVERASDLGQQGPVEQQPSRPGPEAEWPRAARRRAWARPARRRGWAQADVGDLRPPGATTSIIGVR